MTGITDFNYFDYFNLCGSLLELGKGQSANRTVINRSYLAAVMIAASILKPHVTKFPRDHGFYDDVEKAILLATHDSNLMGDLKTLRKDRVDADYAPDIRITESRARECLFEAQSFVQRMQGLF
jgi:hypothetical protein